MEKKAKYINSIVINFLPDVLSAIVLEYTMVIHELELIKKITLKLKNNFTSTIKFGKIWLYDYTTEKLLSEDIDKTSNMNDRNNDIFVYMLSSGVIHIFVYCDKYIHVFDEKCNRIRSMYINEFNYAEIVVIDDKIYVSERCVEYPFIYVYNLDGKFIEKITMPEKVQHIKAFNNQVYVMLQPDKTIRLTDRSIIHCNPTAPSHGRNDFCIIDNYFYANESYKMNIYDEYNNCVRTFKLKANKLYFDNGNLYIYSEKSYLQSLYKLIIYKIKQKNMLQLLK